MTGATEGDAPGLVIAIYRQEGSEGVQACTVIEHIAGPKRYARIWDTEPTHVEWGWTLHLSSVQVWPTPESVSAENDAPCRACGHSAAYCEATPRGCCRSCRHSAENEEGLTRDPLDMADACLATWSTPGELQMRHERGDHEHCPATWCETAAIYKQADEQCKRPRESGVLPPEPSCPDCGHADRLHYALGHVGCHNLGCRCPRVLPPGTGAGQ